MNKIKGLIICNILATLSLSPLSVFAQTDAQQIQQLIEVSIGNNSQLNLYNARIKLAAGDTWINLGNIVPGQNDFKIAGTLDNYPGVFEAQYENGQWIAATFDKDHTHKIAINLELNTDPKLAASFLTTYQSSQPILDLYSVNSHQATLKPISIKNANNVWSAMCQNVDESSKAIICDIYSNPIIQYQGWGVRLVKDTYTGEFGGGSHSPKWFVGKYHKPGSTSYTFIKGYIKIQPEGYFDLPAMVKINPGAGDGRYRYKK